MSPAAAPAASLGAVRDAEFPHLGGSTFLNAASFGPMPQRALAAVQDLLRMRAEDPRAFAVYDLWSAMARCRDGIARLIGARSDEIALGTGTSFGLYLAATIFPQWCTSVGRRVQDTTILVSDREFPANVLPWLDLRAAGTRVEIMDADAAGFPREDALVDRLARGDVGLLAVSAVQFASGHRADLERLGRAANAAGALFVVDAIQAAGALPIDVRSAGIDVLACGGQKWLLAPHGSGFAYVRRELCELEPPLRGWFGVQSSDDVGSLLDYASPLHEGARRFELGSPVVHDQLGLAVAVELLLEVGIANIEAHTMDLLAPLRDWIEAHPRARLASPEPGAAASQILCVALPNATEVYDALGRARVVCALREGRIRFSPHLYNTKDEMDGLIRLLDEIA